MLSTPPAFILSQDRTLNLKFVRSGQNNVGLSQLFYPLLLGLVLFEILLEVCEHIRKMLANPLFSQRFQGCLYCLIFDFQGSWPAHQRDSHMISASLRTVNKNFALFLFFCSSAGNTIFAVFEPHPLATVISIFCIPSLFSSSLLLFAPFRLAASVFAVPLSSHSHSDASHSSIVPHLLSILCPIVSPTLSNLVSPSFLSFLLPLIASHLPFSPSQL